MVAVVVVNLNRKILLEACLESLCHQTLAPAQVILVDNGSVDGSVAMATERFGSRLPLQIIENKNNHGFCRANNQGIERVNQPLVALLNNDAEADPEWLASLVSAMGQAPVGMVASKIVVYADPARIDKVGHLIYPDGQNRGRGSGQTDVGQFDRREEALWPDGCAALYRKELFDQIGGFDEDFFAYADDAELGLRARIAGWDCVYEPNARVRHHRGATLGVASARRLALIERNRILLAVKLFPLRLLVLNPLYYALRLAAGAWASLGNRGETKHYAGMSGKLRMIAGLAQGDWEALRMLPATWRKRKEIERFRKRSDAEIIELLNKHRISLRELSTGAV